jgi:hypothetical protein
VIETVERYVHAGEETDYVMPIWMPFMALIFLIIGGLILVIAAATDSEVIVGFGIIFFGFLIAAGVILHIYVIYKWIDRRNRHFKRTRMLYKSILSFLENRGWKNSEKLRTLIEEIEIEESEKSPAVWIILYIILNPVIFIIFYFLGEDFRKHSIREEKILRAIKEGFYEAGIRVDIPEIYRIPERNFILYLALTIVSFGFFALYWVYVLTNDPNEHFVRHKSTEKRLLEALKTSAGAQR